MSTYNTYEDSTCITRKFSEDAATEMCFCRPSVIGKNSNIYKMVKKGDEVNVGDVLIDFDTSYNDDSLNKLLYNLSDDAKESLLDGARNQVKSKYSGIIEDIKIYSTVELEELSPSLREIVSKYYSSINKKKNFLNKYDKENKDSIVKCGIMITEPSEKIDPNMYGVIKGNKVEDSVLIEFYIKHSEPLEVGSKIAHFTGLKNTISEIIPAGYEPYSHFRPDEEISTILGAMSILARMTPSILTTIFGNKCIIELKRKLKDLNMDRKKMEDLIYKFFTAIDPSGTNTKKYKSLFNPMSDMQFRRYFTDFFANENAYLVLDVIEYERNLKMEDVERGAKVLEIPLYEYVSLPHLSMDKDTIITTPVPVPVGYINEKRTQQTVMKKNGTSTDIQERSALTNQITGHDKNGRSSDLENIMFKSYGMDATIRELNGPRADDAVMKQEMLRSIAVNGYVKLDDLTYDIENKTTLNLVDVYFKGMSLKTDLVNSGLMTNKTLKKELR